MVGTSTEKKTLIKLHHSNLMFCNNFFDARKNHNFNSG